MDALLHEFQTFWQRNSETCEQTSNCTEAFPHLLLMAFLQRITNGGGRIDREYAAGRGRPDLRVEYAPNRYIIEVKLPRDYDTARLSARRVLPKSNSTAPPPPPKLSPTCSFSDAASPSKKLPWEQCIIWETISAATAAAISSLAIVGC